MWIDLLMGDRFPFHMMKWTGIFILLAAQTYGVLADPLPALTIPAGVGVNIHFTTGHERDLKMIEAAGFKFVRMDFSWTATEPQKGVYDWSDYDSFTSELKQHGLRPYY